MSKQGLRCVVYRRVSHENQRESEGGKSLRLQLEKAEAWIKLNEAVLVETFTDEAVSGKSMKNRPAFKSSLELVYSDKADCLIVYSLSRAFRSTQDCLNVCEELTKRGKILVSLTENVQTDNAMSKFFVSLLASLATLERELLAERVQAVMKSKKANGERCGQIPYGMTLSDDGMHLVVNPDEDRVLKRILREHRKGKSDHAIACTLNQAGIPTKNNGLWRNHTIRGILERTA